MMESSTIHYLMVMRIVGYEKTVNDVYEEYDWMDVIGE